MLGGCAQNISLHTMLCKGFALAWFLVDQGLHSNGDEWPGVVVVLAIEVSVCGDLGVDI